MQSYEINRLDHGGYMVRRPAFNTNYSSPPIFASTTVDEALEYIRKNIEKSDKEI